MFKNGSLRTLSDFRFRRPPVSIFTDKEFTLRPPFIWSANPGERASCSGKLICWSDLKPEVNAYILTVWQENWDAEKANKLHDLLPNLGEDLSKRGEGTVVLRILMRATPEEFILGVEAILVLLLEIRHWCLSMPMPPLVTRKRESEFNSASFSYSFGSADFIKDSPHWRRRDL
ncbi:hypothetical protein PoB_001974600 [Plakobranchus ocellatus]|uniref:Uncharacterized protein n=1 Tax=Plakobranchus ocellatus TaxID=259542 RepID=A0AAV3ZBD1_9GAST|nr:hypothetical protein PoB_001974600 [Plakobranchus ocellatus]